MNSLWLMCELYIFRWFILLKKKKNIYKTHISLEINFSQKILSAPTVLQYLIYSDVAQKKAGRWKTKWGLLSDSMKETSLIVPKLLCEHIIHHHIMTSAHHSILTPTFRLNNTGDHPLIACRRWQKVGVWWQLHLKSIWADQFGGSVFYLWNEEKLEDSILQLKWQISKTCRMFEFSSSITFSSFLGSFPP